MNEEYKNLIISYCILFPTSVVFENQTPDSKDFVRSFSEYVYECFESMIVCLILCSIIFLFMKLLKKNISFTKTLYITNFTLSIILLLLTSHILKYLF